MLAGGLGRRMGRPKGTIEVGGVTLACRAARQLAPLCAEVLISVRPGAVHPAPEWPAIEDAPPQGRGPLAGILAGFARTSNADLLVLACDYPHVGTALLRALLAEAKPADEVTVAVDAAGVEHPLVALWRGRMAPRVAAALARGEYAVRDVLRAVAVGKVRVRQDAAVPEPLANWNEPTDR